MFKRKEVLIFLLIFMVLAIQPVVSASEVYIENQEVDFNIEPDKITDSTYLPVNQFKDKLDFQIDELNNDRYIIFYENNYYLISLKNKLIKSDRGNYNLDNIPLLVNNHLLLPMEFFKEVLNLKFRTDQKSIPIKVESEIRANIYLEDNVVEKDEQLRIAIEIFNPTDRSANLRFKSGQKYEIFIKDSSGNIIYTWSKNKMFTQALSSLRIGAKDTVNFREGINLRNFREGIYYIEAIVLDSNQSIKTQEKRIIIQDD